MITIIIKNCNICEIQGPAKYLLKLFEAFKVKHPNAWHIRMYGRTDWDGFIKYISENGTFKIGLLNKVYNKCREFGLKVKIIDNRLPLGVKPVIPEVIGDKTIRPIQKEALEKIVNNRVGEVPFLICASDLAVNFGKCIGKDSLVYTDRGILRISQMMDKDGNLNSEYKVLASDGIYHRICAGVYNKIKALKITTKLGYTQICGYDNHRYLSITPEGNLDWIYAKSLKLGDYMPIFKPDHRNPTSSPKRLLDEAYLMGNLHGDGHLRKASDTRIQISISGVDTENKLEIIRILESITGEEIVCHVHSKINNGWHISKSSKKLSRIILDRYPEIVSLSHGKIIPKYIMDAPQDIQCEYIAGLWDTDGNKSNRVREFSYTSVSEENIHRLQLLLLGLDIHSFVSPKKTMCNGKRGIAFRLRIPSTQVDKFQSIIPIRILRKRYIDKPLRNNFGDRLPQQMGNLVSESYMSLYNTRKVFPNPSKTVRNQLRNPHRLTLEALGEFLKYNQDTHLEHLYEFSNKVYWDKIKSIEIIPEYDCYDICVEDVHHYIADGFICHNTLIFCGLHESFQRKLKTVLLLNSTDLFKQFKTEVPELLPGEDIAFIQGSKCSEWRNFNVCMVQSLAANIKKYQRFLSEVDMVLIDEADVIDNKTFKTVIQHLYNSRVRIGLSGTLYMSDLKKKLVHNMNIMSFIGDKVNQVKLKDMMKAGYSTPIVVKMVYASFKSPAIGEDYATEYQETISNNKDAWKLSYDRAMWNMNLGRLPMLIVCKFIPHCENLYKYYTKRLKGSGLKIAHVHHNTKERDEILQAFREGKIDILIATTIISRGQNFPEMKYLQNTASMDSNEKSIQILGRLARTHMSKKKAYLDDLVFPGKYLRRHGNHRRIYYQKERLKVILIEE